MIRRPLESDKQQLREFFTLVIRDTYDSLGVGHLEDDILDEIESKMNYLELDLNSNGQSQYFLIMLEQDQIIGTSAYGKSGHFITDHMPELTDVLELGSVFIHPEYQNKGYGNQLVSETIDAIKLVSNEFCLDSGYTIAKKIWSKRFGPPTKILKDFWGEGVDHYIWYVNL